MVLAVAYDEAKKYQVRREGDGREIKGGILSTRMFGAHDQPDTPFATCTRQDPGRFSRTHFHIVDQFQVIVEGKCKLGRHELAPYSVHFSRAYTPYGPLVADEHTGFRFFVMRAHPDPGSQGLPENQPKLDAVETRSPWQITRAVTFPEVSCEDEGADAVLNAVSDIRDDHGLAVYTLDMKPSAATDTPDPAHGDGQYLAALEGSVWHAGRELKAPALIFIYAKDGPQRVQAGQQGLRALVLNFPRRLRPGDAMRSGPAPSAGFHLWQCTLCSFTYDEAAGLPEDGIAPGTRWQDVPDSWSCPDCSSSKSDFRKADSNR